MKSIRYLWLLVAVLAFAAMNVAVADNEELVDEGAASDSDQDDENYPAIHDEYADKCIHATSARECDDCCKELTTTHLRNLYAIDEAVWMNSQTCRCKVRVTLRALRAEEYERMRPRL
jgi:hypothetical protein